MYERIVGVERRGELNTAALEATQKLLAEPSGVREGLDKLEASVIGMVHQIV